MKKVFLNLMLLLCALIVGTGNVWGDDYVKVTSTSDLVEGDVYVIAEISDNTTKYLVTGYGSKLTNTTSGFSVSNNTITTSTATPLEFTLGKVTSGNNTYYTLKYGGTNYLGYPGSNANFETATSASDVKEQWSISPSTSAYKIISVKTNTRFIGRNGTNIGPYSTSNSYPNCYLFKKQASTFTVTYNANGATSGAVPTDATKYSSGSTVTVLGNTGSLAKTGYTFGGWNLKADGTGTNYTAGTGTFSITANTTLYAKWNVNNYNVALASVDDVILSVSYGTSSTLAEGGNADIDYGTELTLSATGLASGYMVAWKVTDGEDNDVTNDVLDGTTLTVPAYDITISGTVQVIPLYTVTFNAGTGYCGTSSIKETKQNGGVTLPTATIGVTGWSFVGWATELTSNTEMKPTLYAASSIYKPSDNITLYAVYKFADASTYMRATSVSDITSASSVVIVSNVSSKVLDTTFGGAVTAPTETSSKITAPEKAIFTLTGDNSDGYTLTNGTTTIGAASTVNSSAVSNTTTNDLWKVKASGTSNCFYFENTDRDNLCLEYYDSSWKVYAPTTPSSHSNVTMKVYVPAIVYNSNPAAMINPKIAWATAENKSLYVQDETTYNNAANVTGIAKTPVYTSSDETVATVSEAGVVTAKKSGSATITAKVAKEVGVNSEASVTYDVTVKDAKTIAGLKAITSSSGVVTFTADLTDAVVTYVKSNHAFIQDASGAVYASCGGSLTVGKEINGAISGSIKAANQIDEITAIDLSEATVTDGDIPAAIVQTTAEVATNKASLEGKLVSVTGAKVTASLANGSASGGKIKTGTDSEINLYAPDESIEALKDAEGTFNGYITLYGGSTVRFNIFEQSQITLTKNAPTDQPLAFTSNAVELDEETDAFSAFTGQAVSGAKGTVTYSVDSDDDGVVNSFDSSTGNLVLTGNCGTATIKASAAAKEETIAGIITPWNATTKTYTITVYPRYTVTFNINGVASSARQTAHGASITVPAPAAIGDYVFKGWRTSAQSATDTEPTDYVALSSSTTPGANATYYAVFALQEGTPLVNHTSTFTVKQSSAPSSPYVSDGSSWTWSNVTFKDEVGACIQNTSGSVSFTLPSGGKAKSLKITKTGNTWAGAAEVVLKDASSNTLNTFSLGSNASATYNFTSTYDHSTSYTLTNTTNKDAWTDNIEFKYTTGGITYSDYRSIVPITVVSTPDGYATFYAPYEVEIDDPTAITAYTGTLSENELTLTALTTSSNGVIPKGVAVILKAADEFSATLEPTGGEDAEYTGENDLKGTSSALERGARTDLYVLGYKSSAASFYQFNGTAIPAYKAYLVIGNAQAAPSAIRIVEGENNATNIENLEQREEAVKFFENGTLYIRRAGITYDAMGRMIK